MTESGCMPLDFISPDSGSAKMKSHPRVAFFLVRPAWAHSYRCKSSRKFDDSERSEAQLHEGDRVWGRGEKRWTDESPIDLAYQLEVHITCV